MASSRAPPAIHKVRTGTVVRVVMTRFALAMSNNDSHKIVVQ